MTKHEAVWSNILKSRYRNPVLKVLIEDKSVLFSRDSIQWRDLVKSDNSIFSLANRYAGVVHCLVKNGEETSFWHSQWVRTQTLEEAFAKNFETANRAGCCIANTGCWIDNVWTWKLSELVDNRDGIDHDMWDDFEQLVQEESLVEHEPNTYEWMKEVNGIFKVKSYFDFFVRVTLIIPYVSKS